MARLAARTMTPGNLWKVLVKEGDRVRAGDVLFIMEVMKIEVPHAAEAAGRVASILVPEGTEGLEAEMTVIEIETE